MSVSPALQKLIEHEQNMLEISLKNGDIQRALQAQENLDRMAGNLSTQKNKLNLSSMPSTVPVDSSIPLPEQVLAQWNANQATGQRTSVKLVAQQLNRKIHEVRGAYDWLVAHERLPKKAQGTSTMLDGLKEALMNSTTMLTEGELYSILIKQNSQLQRAVMSATLTRYTKDAPAARNSTYFEREKNAKGNWVYKLSTKSLR